MLPTLPNEGNWDSSLPATLGLTPSSGFINGPISPGSRDMSHQSANDSTLCEAVRSNNWKSHSAINHLYCSQIAILRDYRYSKLCHNLNKWGRGRRSNDSPTVLELSSRARHPQSNLQKMEEHDQRWKWEKLHLTRLHQFTWNAAMLPKNNLTRKLGRERGRKKNKDRSRKVECLLVGCKCLLPVAHHDKLEVFSWYLQTSRAQWCLVMTLGIGIR